MENYTIAETFTLPSKGKVYQEGLVVPTFKISSMTTNQEMRRLSPSELPYKNMADVIDECMIQSPGISAYDMCVGDYQFCLHKLRIVTYGPEYKTISICPYCGSRNEEVLNLEDFLVKEYSGELDRYREFDLPISKKHITLRMQTPRRLDEISVKVKEYKRKNPSSTMDLSLVFALSTLIESIDGKMVNELQAEEFVRQLPMRDTNFIVQNSDKFNDSIGIDTSMTQTCNLCTMDYPTALQITSEFFRPTIDFGW